MQRPDPPAARTHRERVDDVNRIKGLLYEGSLPWDEQSPNALMVTGGTQGGVYFIGRENFTAAGELMGTAHCPLPTSSRKSTRRRCDVATDPTREGVAATPRVTVWFDAEVKPPFTTTTSILVMFRLPEQGWRLWSRHVEGAHADDAIVQVGEQYPDAAVARAREVTTIDWIEDDDAS